MPLPTPLPPLLASCARCGHVTQAPTAGAPDMAQLSCSNPGCRVQLMYPRGAAQVQCSVCSTLSDATQANQLGHVVCQVRRHTRAVDSARLGVYATASMLLAMPGQANLLGHVVCQVRCWSS